MKHAFHMLRCCLFGALVLGVAVPAWAGQFKPGDELWTPRSAAGIPYHHSGVYVGNGKVVHVYATPALAAKRLFQGKPLVRIQKTSMGKFAKGGSVRLGPTKRTFSRKEAVRRALSRVGRAVKYDPFRDNCQHFSSWAVSGRRHSVEARKYKRIHLSTLNKLKKSAIKAGKKLKKGAKALGKSTKKAVVSKKVKAKLKNCGKKRAYVCVYNGSDKARLAARKVYSISPGRTSSIACTDKRKKRCQLRISKSRRCSLSLKLYRVSHNRMRYIQYKRKKFSLSSRCR